MTTETNVRRADARPVQLAIATVLAAGLLIVAGFQAALTLGAPFGAAAMGGTNPEKLPDAVRLVTGFATLAWFLAAMVVLARGGRASVPVPPAVARVGTWVLVVVLGLGTVMNFASSSPWERFGWGPSTLIMFGLCLILARSGSSGHSTARGRAPSRAESRSTVGLLAVGADERRVVQPFGAVRMGAYPPSSCLVSCVALDRHDPPPLPGAPGVGRADADAPTDDLALPEGRTLGFAEARRNVVTRGIDLNALVGRRFRVGNVECLGQRLCEPCAHLERLTTKGALRGLIHRGGLRADVLSDGDFKTGDLIETIE